MVDFGESIDYYRSGYVHLTTEKAEELKREYQRIKDENIRLKKGNEILNSLLKEKAIPENTKVIYKTKDGLTAYEKQFFSCPYLNRIRRGIKSNPCASIKCTKEIPKIKEQYYRDYYVKKWDSFSINGDRYFLVECEEV